MTDKSIKMYGEFDEDDPRYQVRVLGQRIDQMAIDHKKEHDEDAQKIATLQEEMAAMQKVYQRGLGFGAAIIALGAGIGFLFNYGKLIFAPWSKP